MFKTVLILIASVIMYGCDGGLHIYSKHYKPASNVCGEGRHDDIIVYPEKVIIICKNGQRFVYVPEKRK